MNSNSPIFIDTGKSSSNRFSRMTALCLVAISAMLMTTASAQTQMQIYGVWHCYSDACSWASVPNMTTFDNDNH